MRSIEQIGTALTHFIENVVEQMKIKVIVGLGELKSKILAQLACQTARITLKPLPINYKLFDPRTKGTIHLLWKGLLPDCKQDPLIKKAWIANGIQSADVTPDDIQKEKYTTQRYQMAKLLGLEDEMKSLRAIRADKRARYE